MSIDIFAGLLCGILLLLPLCYHYRKLSKEKDIYISELKNELVWWKKLQEETSMVARHELDK